MSEILNFLLHPLIVSLIIVIFLNCKFDLMKNPHKLIIVYFSIAAIIMFFNKSNKMYNWNFPSGLFGVDGVTGNGE